ncbi:MAG: DNA topoisomerase 3 [Pelotomaculum sp. PtaU1.Bin065]|nr:MAG: DNA topoisomerase 3 [Pelotomaculum sp. PtaU1.Bin065]
MRTLLITEKPSVARDIALVLGNFKRREGYLENDQYVVSWAYGHITSLAEPQEYDPLYEKWRLESLPIIPEKFKLTVTERKQFSVLKKLLKSSDVSVVINACDAGREGCLIFRWIYKAAKATLPVKRLWLSETTSAAVRNALNSMKDGADYDNLFAAAEARAKSDWLVGINATRAFTIIHGKHISEGTSRTVSVGRVQTPTLAIIVQREREIRDFVPVAYWRVIGTFNTETGEKYRGLGIIADESDRFHDELSAKAFLERITETGTVAKVHYEEKAEVPPMLFSLNDLQREANHVYGMTAAHVLDVAQSLYEKKLITYPRTDSRHLSESLGSTLERRIQSALKTVPCSFLPNPLPVLNKRFVDDNKITDHHAIIPTGLQVNGNLRSDERNIYEMICRRFISAFLPPHKYRMMQVITEAGEVFLSKGKATISPGWRELYKTGTEHGEGEENSLPVLIEGQKVSVFDVETVKKETKPPARYTDASILSAMEYAGRFVEDDELAETLKKAGGIGTSATRAAILERLIKVGYVQRVNKSLVPTSKGEKFIDLAPEVLKDVETTAQWETGLTKIEQGELRADEWLSGITELTREIVEAVRGQVSFEEPSRVKPHERHGRKKVDTVKNISSEQSLVNVNKRKSTRNRTSIFCPAPVPVPTISAMKERKMKDRRPAREKGILDDFFTTVLNFFKR